MNSNQFKKIELYSNWCYIYRLDGKDIEDGEMLEIKFPNGNRETHAVRVRKFTDRVMDMGNYCDVPCTEVYIMEDHDGLPMKTIIPKGTLARRV